MLNTVAPYSSLALGVIVPMIIKKPMVRSLANGMVIDGALSVVGKLAPGIVSGPYRLPVVAGRHRLNGSAMAPGMVAGYTPARNSVNQDPLKVINGISGLGATVGAL